MTAKQVSILVKAALNAGYGITHAPDRRIGYTTNFYIVSAPGGHHLNTYQTEIQAKRFLAAVYRKAA